MLNTTDAILCAMHVIRTTRVRCTPCEVHVILQHICIEIRKYTNTWLPSLFTYGKTSFYLSLLHTAVHIPLLKIKNEISVSDITGIRIIRIVVYSSFTFTACTVSSKLIHSVQCVHLMNAGYTYLLYTVYALHQEFSGQHYMFYGVIRNLQITHRLIHVKRTPCTHNVCYFPG